MLDSTKEISEIHLPLITLHGCSSLLLFQLWQWDSQVKGNQNLSLKSPIFHNSYCCTFSVSPYICTSTMHRERTRSSLSLRVHPPALTPLSSFMKTNFMKREEKGNRPPPFTVVGITARQPLWLPSRSLLDLPHHGWIQIYRSVNIRNLSLSSIKELADDHMVPSNPFVKPQLQVESNGTSKSRVTRPAGMIPKGVCLFPYLTSLTLQNNSLNGTIPTCLFTVPSMKELHLGNNMFSGSLPKFNKPNSNLEELSLNNNLLSGDISSFLKKLPSLKSVGLSFNDFTGTINYSLLSSLQNLTELDASNNQRLRVESSSYSTIDAHDTSFNLLLLQWLNLSSCSIQSFPKFICQLQGLSALDLSDNDMEGKVPSCLWNISGLSGLYLDQNKLDGFQQPVNVSSIGSQFYFSLKISSNHIIGSIPSFLCNLTGRGFIYTDMSNNFLRGGIPDCLYKLNMVKLRKNQLWGQIPSGLICNIQLLDLNDNFLTGKIPKSFSNCTHFAALDLGNNELEDAFPSGLGQLNKLKVLILRSNHLYGPIPAFSSPQVFAALKILNLANNHFSGTLSYELFDGLKAMVHVGPKDVLPGYFLIPPSVLLRIYGEVEQPIKGKSSLIKPINLSNCIDLSNNEFSGKIPEVIGSLRHLRSLNISNNHLDGPIPRSFGNLLQLEWLDLSQNCLSGAILLELVALTFLSTLNLSYNDLQGRIPQGNQFNTFDISSFEGNPKLCGQQVNRACSDVLGVELNPYCTLWSSFPRAILYFVFSARGSPNLDCRGQPRFDILVERECERT